MLVRSLTTDITPIAPVFLAGFSGRSERVLRVHSCLELTVFEMRKEQKSVLVVSIDNLFVTEELELFFRQKIVEILGAETEFEIVLNASHTHYAPCIENRTTLGSKDEEYLTFLKTKIFDILTELKRTAFSNCEILLEQFHLHKIVANRRRRLKPFFGTAKTVMEPVESVPANDVLSVITFANGGNSIAKFAVFACHPTNLYDNTLVSAEFVHQIRQKLGDLKTPVLFLQGFSGDVRAFPPKSYYWHRLIYRFFGRSYPVRYYRFNETEYNSWVANLSGSISESNRFFMEQAQLNNFDIKQVEIPVVGLGFSSPHAANLQLKMLNLGICNIVFMSAETLSGYVPKIESLSSIKTLCVGYSGNCFGYLPTNNDVRNGGYEVYDFKKAFELSGTWSANFETAILDEVKKMIS